MQSQQAQPGSRPRPSIQANVVLVKGEGFDRVSYQLRAWEHVIGRINGTILFPEDLYLSPVHANLYYENNTLFLKDEGSANGVFVRLQEPVELTHGDMFLTGEQLLRFEQVAQYESMNLEPSAAQEDTQFYGCPREDNLAFRIVHLFRDMQEGAVYYASGDAMGIGREQADLSFPFDRHISGRHARVYRENGRFFLQDLGSKNGTFFRITQPRSLRDGDQFFIGQQLMRVELKQNLGV